MCGRHVVEKDNVYAGHFDKSADLFKIIRFHFNSDIWPLFANAPNSIGKTGNPFEGGQMIVFYEHHVVQAKTMINATTSDYWSLFQCAQARGGFARIQYLGRIISDSVDEFAREGCDAAEALQKIQRDPFRLENRTCQATQFDNNVAGIDVIAIAATNLDVRPRIDPPKNFRGCAGTRNDRFFMRNDASGCVQGFRHEKISRDVAVADVFFKCGGDGVVII